MLRREEGLAETPSGRVHSGVDPGEQESTETMAKAQGTVTSVEGLRAYAEVSAAACGAGGCGGGCACGSAGQTREIEFALDRAGAVQPGDVVELDLTLPNVAVAAVVLFGMPLLLAVGAAIGGRTLGYRGDLQTLGAGAIGLIAGFALAAIADRLLPGLRARGEFRRIVTHAVPPCGGGHCGGHA